VLGSVGICMLVSMSGVISLSKSGNNQFCKVMTSLFQFWAFLLGAQLGYYTSGVKKAWYAYFNPIQPLIKFNRFIKSQNAVFNVSENEK